MTDLVAVLRSMLPPLRVEYRTGCLNNAAIGGFDQHLLSLVREALPLAAGQPAEPHLRRMAEILAAYRGLDLATRAKRLREIKRRLDALLAEQPAPDQGTEAPPPETLPPVSAVARLPEHPPNPALFAGRKRVFAAGESTPEPPTPTEAPRASGAPSPAGRRVGLDDPVQYFRGVGPQRARLLEKLGIEQAGDFLFHFPRRHEDRSHLAKLSEARLDMMATFQGRVRSLEELRPQRSRVRVLKVVVTDGTGVIDLVWFNQPWLKEQIRAEQLLIFSGRVQADRYGRRQIVQPAWEHLEADGEAIHTGRLVPIYPLTEGLVQTTVRRWVKQALDQLTNEVPEVLPLGVRETWELVGRREAIRSYHFPASEAELRLARRRLVFEEFFGLQVALAQRRHEYDHRGHGIAFKTDSALTAQLHRSLPFELTDAQQRVLQEIRRDLAQPRPMNRLVQGDVGSGKTLVALSAMLTVVDNGYQAALMVPTEILAEQHHRVLRHWCEPLGVSLDLITGRAGSKQRRESQARLSQGETQIAVGTHALIQEGIDFDHLGLVVVDEQHRFGVLQRKLLSGKGETPDVLVMTATPIPRTLALTVYGELDVSVIDELPRGRTPIVTEWYPLGKRRELYSQIKERLRAGRQAYVVCPLVEESEALEDVEAATAMAEHLREHFKGFEVGLIHGRLKPAEKDEVMLRFRAGKIDLLAATTVIEVGIDVPNATIMLIVNADRFGLAQLHQLRGRVGRGAHESQCYLLTDARYNPELAEDESSLQYRDARARMRFLRDYSDGFRLAEADLELRGPGELGGTRQSGSLDFRVANLASDGRLLEDARTAAQKLVKDDPHLALADHAALARFVAARYRDRGQLAEVG